MWVHVALVGPEHRVPRHGDRSRCSSCAPAARCLGHRRGATSTARCRPSPSWFRRGGSCRRCRAEKSLFLWFFAMLIVPGDRSCGSPIRLWRQSPHAARRDADVRCAVQRRHRAAGPAATRLDAPVVGHVHLVPVPDPRRRRVRHGVADRRPTPRQRSTAGVAAALALTLVVAPAVHVPLLPAAHAGQRRQRADAVPGVAATGVASTSATSGRTSPAAT